MSFGRASWLCLLWLWVSGLVVHDGLAAEQEPLASAVLDCERRSSRGRIVCELEAVARRGRLAWADVVVTSAPGFALPLKNRVGLREARARSAERMRLPLALFARDEGEGTLRVAARMVVCEPAGPRGEHCRPIVRRASTAVVVGPIP